MTETYTAGSVADAIQPYMGQATQEMSDIEEIGAQLAELVVETARRVAEDGGESRALFIALDALTTAERAFWRAQESLVEARAIDLWHDEVDRVSA